MQSELEKAARGFMELFVNDNGSQPGLSLDGIDPIDLTDRYVALESALSAAEPSVAVKEGRMINNSLLSQVLQNAFFAGRGTSGVVSPEDMAAWQDYDPYHLAAYQRIRSALPAQVQDVAGPEVWQLVPKDDENRCVADSALPHEMIEAGIRAQEQVNDDNCNYMSGETTDWDCGMVAVAIYRAMLAAAPAKQEA